MKQLDKKWKLWVYRIGLATFCMTGIGMILFLGYYNWTEDKWKKKEENQQLNERLETVYYYFGFVGIVIIGLIIVCSILDILAL